MHVRLCRIAGKYIRSLTILELRWQSVNGILLDPVQLYGGDHWIFRIAAVFRLRTKLLLL